MKKAKLKEEVSEIKEKEASEEYERQLKENVLCRACLNEQRIQRKIDKIDARSAVIQEYHQTLLVCESLSARRIG